MSVTRLQLEQDLRRAEEARELEELRIAAGERAALSEPISIRPIAYVLKKSWSGNPYDECAAIVEKWWALRRKKGEPTDAEMRGLVKRISNRKGHGR